MVGDAFTARDRPTLDLTSCDREPIHAPGFIQPHGLLFGFSRDGLRLTAISANADRHLGRDPYDLLDGSLADVLDGPSYKAVAAASDLANGESVRFGRVGLFGHPEKAWRATLHADTDGLLLELEFAPQDTDIAALTQFERFQTITHRLQSVSDVEATCRRLVEEVRRLTEYDHVMLYRFAPDWSGEVVAEESNGIMPSYMGLHFPQSDIPVQARALYVRNVERQIPDVGYRPVPLLCSRPGPLDISQAGLRSVSPMHVAYLRNMGVGAAMSISLLRRGELWGLIACHHRTAHRVSLEIRQACVLLGQLAMARLGLIEEAEFAQHAIAAMAVETALLHEAVEGRDYHEAPQRNSGAVLNLLDASGLVISCGGSVTTLGDTPGQPMLDRLLEWLSAREPAVLATDNLADLLPGGGTIREAAGILAVPLGGVAKDMLVWLRPEITRTVSWAGDPVKPVETVQGQERLTPRQSFAAWAEEVRGRSRPWTQPEIAAANGLRDTIFKIIARRSLDVVRLNAQLKRSNDELEAFAYVASHDLKEPLRQIETFGTLLERAFARRSDDEDKIAGWFDGIRTSSRRLRQLINDLADYSRLGGQAQPFAPVDLDRLLKEVLRDLEARIQETGASIVAERLPVVTCDATQMRQVLQNLIANALKYRHPDRAPLIRVSVHMPTLPVVPPADASPCVTLIVADNGIGFDDRHREQIFKPFERLHSSDAYEGSGLGLAICRKVADRHGGTITAHGRPGEGATFLVTIPLRLLPDAAAAVQ